MKLKVSFCNKTVLRTDITRFAPVWGTYVLGLAMLVLLQIQPIDTDEQKRQLVRGFQQFSRYGVAINGLYAMVVVQALFGDLLNPRLCNSLHAMPVTRDGFYGAHLAAGLLFAIVPNCLVFLPTSLFLGKELSCVALWTLLALCLQYIFYLGTALLAVQLAGNRAGMILTYGILNFATLLLYWFVAMVFVPLIYGKDVGISWVAKICPTVAMYDGDYFTVLDHSNWADGQYFYFFDGVRSGALWLKCVICAGIGVVCMAVAQLVYRRRKLETAGDLLAFPVLSPFFLGLYTLTVAAFLHLGVKQLAQGSISGYFFLPLGLIAGYITGLMLLRRTSRVFRWRLLVPLGGILAVCGLCMLAIITDVFHVIRYVPQEDKVESVTLAPVQLSYDNLTLTLTEPQEIEDVLSYHQGALRDWQDQVVGSLLQRTGCWTPGDYLNIQLRYNLKNGHTLQRRYLLERENPAYERLAPYLSRPELSLGMNEEKFRQVIASATAGDSYFYNNDGAEPDPSKNRTFTTFVGLSDAILEDCASGSLMSLALYTPADSTQDFRYEGGLSITYNRGGEDQYLYINLNSDCRHTLYWISTHGTPSKAVG